MKKALLLVFLIPQLAFGAIAFDTASNRQTTTGTSLTFAHTTTGSNLILFVGVTIDTNDVLTGITYNGTALTQVSKIQTTSGRWSYLYYLTAPSTGSNNVVISASESVLFLAYASSYTGVEQTTPIDSYGTNTVTSVESINKFITTTCTNDWLVSTGNNGSGATSAGSNTTLRGDSSSYAQWFSDSNAVQTPAGSFGQTVSWSGSNNASIIVASIKASTDSVCDIGGGESIASTTATTTNQIISQGFLGVIFGLALIIFMLTLFVTGYLYNNLIKPIWE